MPDGTVRLGRRCVGLDGTVLRFDDGGTAAADVVIGADGIHSVVRGVTPATYSGLCAFRALVPAGKAPAFARRRAQTVTLLGDAAHPMFPFFAQGAAQALEDAAVLARCLAEQDEPEVALRRYEALRIPRTARLQDVSHARSHVNRLPDGPEQRDRDRRLAEADPLVANGWIYDYDADATAGKLA